MADAAPNPVDLVPDDQPVFRVLTCAGWYRRRRFTYRPFVLRSHEGEEEISLGLSPEAALEGLNEPTYGFAKLLVGDIHALNKGLSVRFKADHPLKAELWGLPPWPEDEDQRDIPMAVAEDLAEISEFVPPLSDAGIQV
jgi:hypothetical protein